MAEGLGEWTRRDDLRLVQIDSEPNAAGLFLDVSLAKPAPPQVLVRCCPFLGNLCLWGPLKRRSRGHLVAALDTVSGRARSAAFARVTRWQCVCCRAGVFSFPFVLVFFCGVLSALCLRECEALWERASYPSSYNSGCSSLQHQPGWQNLKDRA